jgi:hypothetical protein
MDDASILMFFGFWFHDPPNNEGTDPFDFSQRDWMIRVTGYYPGQPFL